MSQRTLYISGRCEHSKKILLGIKQHMFLKDIFTIVNIDTMAFPNYIKSVPSLVINDKLIVGENVFNYFGRIVDEKMKKEASKNNDTSNTDNNQCRLNEDGELEGWCANSHFLNYSPISESNDDYTKSHHKYTPTYDFLEGGGRPIDQIVKEMEAKDEKISANKQSFDNDMKRMEEERNQMSQGDGRLRGGSFPPSSSDMYSQRGGMDRMGGMGGM